MRMTSSRLFHFENFSTTCAHGTAAHIDCSDSLSHTIDSVLYPMTQLVDSHTIGRHSFHGLRFDHCFSPSAVVHFVYSNTLRVPANNLDCSDIDEAHSNHLDMNLHPAKVVHLAPEMCLSHMVEI